MIILAYRMQSIVTFSLKRNIHVPGIYKGEKGSRKIEESFHLIEPTGLYYYCKPLRFTRGSGCKVLPGLHNKQLTLTTNGPSPCLSAVSQLHKALHTLFESIAVEAIHPYRERKNHSEHLYCI